MIEITQLIDKRAKELINFWFLSSSQQYWFIQNNNFDNLLKEKFSNLYTLAQQGQLDDWVDIPLECLALIICLDQLPRNLFRGDKQTYDTDQEALELAKHAHQYNYLNIISQDIPYNQAGMFLFLPFMHSEQLSEQKTSLNLFKNLSEESYKHAVAHHNIIQQFGRFPHRNKILGRKSTKAELDYLKASNYLV